MDVFTTEASDLNEYLVKSCRCINKKRKKKEEEEGGGGEYLHSAKALHTKHILT